MFYKCIRESDNTEQLRNTTVLIPQVINEEVIEQRLSYCILMVFFFLLGLRLPTKHWQCLFIIIGRQTD